MIALIANKYKFIQNIYRKKKINTMQIKYKVHIEIVNTIVDAQSKWKQLNLNFQQKEYSMCKQIG